MAPKTRSSGSVPPETQRVFESPRQKEVVVAKDYSSEGVKDNDITNLSTGDYEMLAGLTLVAFFVRLFRIYQPTSVVFDEVHFGGFASKYIKGKFFMDVHPPLAKLMLTLAGYLAGFDGEFDFKEIGKDYIEPGVPYVAMRLIPAICGVLTVPIVFLTLKASGCKTISAALGASLVIFDNALVTQSRLILLDSPLVVFTAFTALAWTAFGNLHEQGPKKAFTPLWWTWLSLTGLGLGATVSVKWVGLFTIAWVGSLTVLQLWVLLGDPKTVTPRLWFKHFFARTFCLVVIPVSFYMSMFALHFICLVNPGEGDGFMSSEFQSTLNNKGMADAPADVLMGSRVSIRHYNTQGGYLHSHAHQYPTGSKQQQITLYPHKDDNNVWLFENMTQPLGADGNPINGSYAWDNLEPHYVTDGAVLRLFHITTSRRLHSHDVRPPVSEADWQNEVSAYGYDGFEGDANDYFRVEIVEEESDGEVAQDRVRAIQTKFRLIHVMSGCALFSHKVKLPDWGFEQQEVTCAKQGTLPNSIWYIEGNEHPLLGEDAEKVNYRHPGFFGKFWELQKVMWTTNAGLVESHNWDSRPPSWPILQRGINFWSKHNRQIYLIGNPIIWWSSTASIGLYVLFKGLAVLRWQRSCEDYSNVNFKRFDYEVGTTVLGWAFHYFPFYLMQRQLFLHHYLPALVFAIIVLSQTFDFVFSRIGTLGFNKRPSIARTGAVSFLALSIAAFYLYAPLAYGNGWTRQECARVKLFDKWDWDCNNFLDNYADYSTVPTVVMDAQQTQAMAGPKPPVADDPKDEVVVTPQAEAPVVLGEDGRHTSSKVEYRDELGNLLNEEQVKALSGKVSFSTRYETRTRKVDAAGNVIEEGPADGPLLPDAEEPKTPYVQGSKQDQPAENEVGDDLAKEKKVDEEDEEEASPEHSIISASDGAKDEL